MKRLCTQLLLFALLLCGTAQAEVTVPKLTQRVTDLTATLDAAQTQALDARLAAFGTGKGSQIAVLIVPTTKPEEIEQFSIRVAEAWKQGRKGVDDGVLLLIAKDDRKLRIEVGYGLEGALNDATAKRIVAEVITPYFKRGEFYAGIDAGVTSIIKVVEGEPLPPPAQSSSSGNANSDSDKLGNVFGIAFIIFMFGNIILRQMLGRLPSGLIVGGLIGGLVWITLLSAAWAAGIAFLAFVFSLIFGMSGRGSSFPSGWGGGGGGGWGSGGGGGGFSGGGGGFGGGGASGGW
ncbi:MAG: YgcG family protein [Sideroxydans sp.]|nr:YgcG family protein [Sideroxydans sp.]